MSKILMITALLILSASAYCEEWSEIFDYYTQDYAFDCCENADGGVFVVGACADHNITVSSKIRCISIDVDGTIHSEWPASWARCTPGYEDGINVGMGVCQTGQSNMPYAVTGYSSTSSNTRDYHLIVFKVNRWGAVMQEFVMSATGTEGSDIIKASDGGYIVVGFRHFITQKRCIYVLKLNSDLEFQWAHESILEKPTPGSTELGLSVYEMPDGRILVGGTNLTWGNRTIVLDGSNGQCLVSYSNSTDLPYSGSVTGFVNRPSPSREHPRFLRLSSYDGPGDIDTACLYEFEFDAPPYQHFHYTSNYLNFSLEEGPMSEIASLYTYFPWCIEKTQANTYLVGGVAQYKESGSWGEISAPIIVQISRNLEIEEEYILEPNSVPLNLNSFSPTMKSGFALDNRGLSADAYYCASLHYGDGYGGYDSEWDIYVVKVANIAVWGLHPTLQNARENREERPITVISDNRNHSVSCYCHSESSALQGSIYDLAGRAVLEVELLQEAQGHYGCDINMGSYAKGLYYLVIQVDPMSSETLVCELLNL